MTRRLAPCRSGGSRSRQHQGPAAPPVVAPVGAPTPTQRDDTTPTSRRRRNSRDLLLPPPPATPCPAATPRLAAAGDSPATPSALRPQPQAAVVAGATTGGAEGPWCCRD